MVEYRPMPTNLLRRNRRTKLTSPERLDVFGLPGALFSLNVKPKQLSLSEGCFFVSEL
jgi:hypothetical protein